MDLEMGSLQNRNDPTFHPQLPELDIELYVPASDDNSSPLSTSGGE